jgi:rod shape determining protein RodA
MIKLAIEVIINIGVNIGLLPVVGIALPFLTLGGSHLVADFIMLGIIANIHYY